MWTPDNAFHVIIHLISPNVAPVFSVYTAEINEIIQVFLSPRLNSDECIYSFPISPAVRRPDAGIAYSTSQPQNAITTAASA